MTNFLPIPFERQPAKNLSNFPENLAPAISNFQMNANSLNLKPSYIKTSAAALFAWPRRAVNEPPAAASMMQTMASHCRLLRCSLSINKPSRAATAGSKLVMMPKASCGNRFKAIISSDMGIALEMAATPSPNRRIWGSSKALPACHTPNGTTVRAATVNPIETE